MIFSTSATPSTFLSTAAATAPPFPPPSSAFSSFLPPRFISHAPPPSFRLLRSTPPRRFVFASQNVNAMAELVNSDKNRVLTEQDEQEDRGEGRFTRRSSTFLDAKSEEDILSGIKKEAEAGRLPSIIAAGMEELYHNYKNAVKIYAQTFELHAFIDCLGQTCSELLVLQSGHPNAAEIVLSNMSLVLDRVFVDVEDAFVFSPYHKALREPFDYYEFGQNYIRPLIDFRNSYVGNVSIFSEIEEKLQQGHNVILMSNHQTEADPAVIALLLETTNRHISENLIYVAGDRVLTDPLCKPFSMGRNLFCVYSKKHMLDVPELVEMKKKANIRSLKEMAMLLRNGSQIVWIAPSGGRDRPDPVTGEWHPAPFDTSSVDNMRRLADNSGAPGHIYPLALLCSDIMPPPPKVEKEIGEKRVIAYSGTGLSVGKEIKFHEIASAYENPEQAKEAYTKALYDSVSEQYNVLQSAVQGKHNVSSPEVSLSQPWSNVSVT
ncbi:Glycerol-3-phosphate acyltransferase, chloroplastic [Linum perenne]